jgi:Flp pilus assembly protein TadD
VARRSDPLNQALGAAAVGLAMVDAGAAEAATRSLPEVQPAHSPVPATSGDAYQDGRTLLAAGDTAGAIAAFRTALVASPQSVDAMNGLGVAYDRIGRFDLSRSWYDTALAIDPTAIPVLNNLGYSLYLQGSYAAAIPLLQQVVDSDDPAARQTGQRLLTMIAARMRADAIAGRPVSFAETAPPRRETMASAPQRRETMASAPPRRDTQEAAAPRRETMADAAPSPAAPRAAPSARRAAPVTLVEAPQARIEITSSGEQRLVIGGAAPAPELVAALGDAAPMVTVADAWTPRAEARLAARLAAEERALAERARMAGQLAIALAEVRAPVAPAAPMPAAPMPSRDEPPAAPAAAVVPVLARVEPDARPRAAMIVEAAPAPATAGVTGSAPTPGVIDGAGPTPATLPPAWLLSTRRVPRPTEAAAAHDEPVGDTALAFESDDSELNAFAARMRGIAPPAEVITIPREEAVARLEGLLRRLRSA